MNEPASHSELVWLRQYFEAQIKSMRELYEQARVSDREAITAALKAVAIATQKAEDGAKEWRLGANEWRTAMDDRERRFMPRAEAEAGIAAVALRAKNLEEWRTLQEGKKTGSAEVWGLIVGVAGVVGGAVIVLIGN